MKPKNIFFKIVSILTVCISGISLSCHSQIITTICGTGGSGFSGDGGLATAAQMGQPWGLARDPAGNIYFSDYQHRRIRKIDPTGIVTTIAGNGGYYSGDGGPATAAGISGPTGIAIYGTDIYFADAFADRIRKIDAAGIVTTVAGNGISGTSGDGGPATMASISEPDGVWVDNLGNIYIPDQYTNHVRKVNTAGIITTIAGTGAAGYTGDGGPAIAATMSLPDNIVTDAAGNVYFSDLNNNVVRKIDNAGIISTFAGNGVGGFSGDGGPATAAMLHTPAGVHFDASGNFYISDASNNRIRKITPAGIISTIAGTGVAGFGGDGGDPLLAKLFNINITCTDPSGTVYIADMYNNRIRKIVYSNHPPVFTGGTSQTLTICQNSGATPINTLLAVNDTDVSQTETWSMYLAPLHGTAIAAYTTTSTGTTLTPTGLSYTPAFGYAGSDSFKVRVTDGTASDSITIYVTISPLPVAGTITGSTTLCAGSTISLTDTTVGGTWTSSNTSVAIVGSATGIVSGIAAGSTIISYSVTNTCGTAVDTQMISVIGLPISGTIVGSTSLCPGTSATFTDPITGGTWSCSNPSVAIVGATSGIVTGIATGTAIISYSVTNMCGTAVDTQAISVTLIPGAGTITGPAGVCTGAIISLSNTTTGGTWTSSNPSIATVGSTSGIVGGVSTGTVIITYTVTNACGTATVTQAVTVSPAPFAGLISGPASLCEGAMITLGNTTTGGAWSSSTVAVAAITGTGVVNGVSAGTTIISYSVTNSCGTAVDTQAVTINPLPSAGVINAASHSICNGTSFTLTNTGTGGTWTSSNTSVATIDPVTGHLSTLTTGTTTIIYTTAPNSFGCINQTTFPVSVIDPALFNITATIDQVKCNGESNGSISVIIPTGTWVGPYQYTWSNGSTSSSISGLTDGTYNVIVKDIGTNCTDTQSFSIIMPLAIDVTPVIKNSYCKLDNGSIMLSVSGGTTPYTFAWADGATDQDRINLATGTYVLNITDKNSCTKQLTVIVDEDSCSNLVIHDVLTPNGDGKNDTWIIEGLYAYPNNTVQVFDKWGDAVFSGKKYENDWDGKNPGGSMLPDGTYFYLLKLNADNVPGGKNTFTGSLLIKR